MTPHERTRRRRLRRIRITGWTALTSLLVTLVGFLTYFHIVFPAERSATLEVFRDDRVQVEARDARVIMSPTGDSLAEGVLYFPGARVDPYSYLYPLVDIAAAGTTVVIVDPLFNMALIDSRGVSELTSDFPEITSWILAGHSLGGVKACLEASHPSVTHLVLFASYCANDISDLDISVLHVVGDRDGLLDDSLRRDAESLLPPGRHTTITLQGANHADFGTYGPQPGDGESTVTDQVMRTMITDALDAHISRD
jgi:hypothetical protein